LLLACASSDGTISIITFDQEWSYFQFEAHGLSANVISWIPSTTIKSENGIVYVPTIISGGCDNLIKIWSLKNGGWNMDTCLEGHTDWIRDVICAPSYGDSENMFASCSQDGVVFIWKRNNKNWEKKKLELKFDEIIWRLSWSLTGNILAVTSGDKRVTLWKETREKDWICLSTIGDT